MKIGVIGPPEAGKTRFANKLAKLLDEQPVVIDGYVQKLQKATNLALGPWASYVENFMIAGERMKQEERFKHADSITVGTIVDTVLYCLMRSDIALHSDQVQERYRQAQVAMNTVSFWYAETWDYNVIFFLPYTNPQDKARWKQEYSAYVPDVLQSFGVPGVVTIERGNSSERATLAAEIIDAVREEQSEGSTEASAPVE